MSNEAIQTPKRRRGVSNETKAIAQLKFHERDAVPNGPASGLFLGHLEDVVVNWAVGSERSSFSGLKIPYLTFHFTSNHASESEKRHVYHNLFPVESTVNTIPEGSEEWRVENVTNWIKHMLDTFVLTNRLMTEAEETALSLPFCDFDEQNQYVAVEPQEVLDGYAFIFNNAAAMLNGTFNIAEGETPKCTYKNANGTPITLWMKLLRHRKTKKGWVNIVSNGDLGFDGFIGSGCIEVSKGQGTLPSRLRLDSKESIIPQETKKVPTLGGMVGDVSMPMMNLGMNNPTPNFEGNPFDDMPY